MMVSRKICISHVKVYMLCVHIYIYIITNKICINFTEFFKQFLTADSKKSDIGQLLSVAQQLNKLGQGKIRIVLRYKENTDIVNYTFSLSF